MGAYFTIYLKGDTAKRFAKLKAKSKYVTRLIIRDLDQKKLRKEGILCPACGNYISCQESLVPLTTEAG